MMTNKNILSALTLFAAIGGVSFGVWALDQRYMTVSNFEQAMQQQRLQNLGDRIDELTLKESLNLATDYEKAILKQLKEKVKRGIQ